MEEVIYTSLYDPVQLEPIIERLNVLINELVATKVYSEWLLGLSTALFALSIVIIFAIFFSQYK